MSESMLFPQIPEIQDSIRFWMLRTKQGLYYYEFLEEHYIALGWNAVLLKDVEDSEKDESFLRKTIASQYKTKNTGNILGKCVRFCREMKPGDIVMIVGDGTTAFAKIEKYYEVNDPYCSVEKEDQVNTLLKQEKPEDLPRELLRCPYRKRWAITVLREFQCGEPVSPYLSALLARNTHSLSDVTEYADVILNLCYDAYYFRGKLTMAFKVSRRSAIRVQELTSFVLNAAEILSPGNVDRVSVKTTLHSPGDIILQVVAGLGPCLLCYVAVFGGKVGDCEFNSLISLLKDFLNRKNEAEKQALERRKLKAEAESLEQDVIRKKLENQKLAQELAAHLSDPSVRNLAAAAEKLEIKPTTATVIDLRELLDKAKEPSAQ